MSRDKRPWGTLKQGETTALGDKIEVTTSREKLLCLVIDTTGRDEAFGKPEENDHLTCKDCRLYPSHCAIRFDDVQCRSGLFYHPLRKTFRCSLFEPREVELRKICNTCGKCNGPRCPWQWHTEYIHIPPASCPYWEGIKPPPELFADLEEAVERMAEGVRKLVERDYKAAPTFCCASFKEMIRVGVFGGNDNCRNGSVWIMTGEGVPMQRMALCPFCGAKV